MNNRELLELAAVATGYSVDFDLGDWPVLFGQGDGAREWNPLKDDGDALWLAVKLGIDLKTTDNACFIRTSDMTTIAVAAEYAGDIYSATRLAITLAAAEIGRGMQ